MNQTTLLGCLAAALMVAGMALAWWGWHSLDAGMLLLGVRLC
ncbi:hypothetical protein VRRI112168_10995 [Vreelandella rituensis]|nr:hypothetical protein [Halomonas rituensis]